MCSPWATGHMDTHFDYASYCDYCSGCENVVVQRAQELLFRTMDKHKNYAWKSTMLTAIEKARNHSGNIHMYMYSDLDYAELHVAKGQHTYTHTSLLTVYSSEVYDG